MVKVELVLFTYREQVHVWRMGPVQFGKGADGLQFLDLLARVRTACNSSTVSAGLVWPRMLWGWYR